MPSPFVFDPTVSPVEQETQPVLWFMNNRTTNPKKLVKMATQIEDQLPQWIRRSFTDIIKTAKHPIKTVDLAILQVQDWPVVIEELISQGNHGMILHDRLAYGVTVNTRWSTWLQKDNPWNSEDEADIRKELIDKWMVVNNCRDFKGKMVLFPEFGFSGIPRRLHYTFTKEFFSKLTDPHICEEKVDQMLREARNELKAYKESIK